ncbi:hypothetical protein PoB_004531100 [Plakobranchus ocellatus]|uniref:Uncharacterized protein n=1 Tax=Plakobranchus ocellatus TaxID=259542 RepID=A0AAV4B5Z3_9GAST|nr:hypothetical protein PoB_004531100 [Plakobranchus ocellatus]
MSPRTFSRANLLRKLQSVALWRIVKAQHSARHRGIISINFAHNACLCRGIDIKIDAFKGLVEDSQLTGESYLLIRIDGTALLAEKAETPSVMSSLGM